MPCLPEPICIMAEGVVGWLDQLLNGFGLSFFFVCGLGSSPAKDEIFKHASHFFFWQHWGGVSMGIHREDFGKTKTDSMREFRRN